ncbi:MAG TPA: hypothetical protein VKA75_04120, partial [Reyranella sp.]|nr:hypothetical protein [Reyranella sp.]
MKRGVLARSRALDLEQPTGSDHDVAIVDWDAGPPRQGRTVSEAVVCRFVSGLDIAAILGAGAAAIHLDTSTVDWRLEGLVVLLGALLASNFLRLTGAYRFRHFSDLGASIGRSLLGWLLTLGTLFVAAFFFDPITATNGPWTALWFSLGAAVIVASRVALNHQVKNWHRAGRL